MRTVARLEQGRKALRQREAQIVPFPAPVGGWNARDAIAEMAPTDAISLVNWWPRATDVQFREGCSNHVTGIPTRTLTLAVYSALNGTQSMFGSTATNIYNVTSAGAVGAAVASCTNGKWQTLNFGDGGTQYLIMVNGVDKPFYYNGTIWIAVDGVSSPALTGVTTTTLIHVNIFKERLFFIPVNSLSFWYLPAGTVGGALTEYSLESYCRKGGYLMAMATWTIDGGAGVDDLAVFVTSEGEAVVFSGTNPSSIASWSLVGIYQIGRPIGRRCFQKLGGDLVLLTDEGVLPLSKALASATVDRTVALSDRINQAFATAAKLYRSNFGWEVCVLPKENALVVNVPTTDTGVTAEQYCMNIITRRWTKFSGWNASCFAVMGGELYYGDATTVVKAWTGTSDKGTPITADAKQAFNYLGAKNQFKQPVGYRPTFTANGPFEYTFLFDVDFSDTALIATATGAVGASGSLWGTAVWGTAVWGGSADARRDWQTPGCYPGYCFAVKLRVVTTSLSITWVSNEVLYQPAVGLV